MTCVPFIIKMVFSFNILNLVGYHSLDPNLPEYPILNRRPIIGILSQEPDNVLEFPTENYTSYIPASCVKNLEASGARVVPIMIGKDRHYYQNLLGKLNGVLFPGGCAPFNSLNGYAEAGALIYEITEEINDAGEYFPLFGVCLGFELIVTLAAGRNKKNILVNCSTHNNQPLRFSKDFRKSKMFAYAPDEIIFFLSYGENTINSHDFCVLLSNFKHYGLMTDWIPTSYGYDENGIRFIASIESRKYPIYGIQFHPEKVPYEWIPKHFVHGPNALLANRYFMDFFVDQSKKNAHTFCNVSEENDHLIYNYDPIFTGRYNSVFEQAYMFEPSGVKGKSRGPVYDGLDLTPKTQGIRYKEVMTLQ